MLRKETPNDLRGKGKLSCCLWILLLQTALTIGVFLFIASTFQGCC